LIIVNHHRRSRDAKRPPGLDKIFPFDGATGTITR
jgi:hypothetical protein